MTAADFISRLGAAGKPRKKGNGWTVCCPAHEDRNPSLSVSDGDKGVVLKCFSGCTVESICAAVGVKVADLFNGEPKRNGEATKGKIVATYDYTDESGKLLFQVVRKEPKTFPQRQPDGKGGWNWKMAGVRRVLFGLPKLIEGINAGFPVFICEGEKDCLALQRHGLTTTCNAGGAESNADGSKWLPEYTEALRGADVCIIADKDTAGRTHARIVANHLHGVAKSIRVIELPDVGGRTVKDAHDYIEAGGAAGDILTMASEAELWTPETSEAEIPENSEIVSPEAWRQHAQEWTVKRLLEPIDYKQSLLGDRFLERGGTAAVVAPSGVGKTVGSVQMAAHWSIGRPAFHIKPSGPLRVLVVQNEDTENDTKGPLQGVIANLNFKAEDVKLMHANLKIVRLVALRGLAAAEAIRGLATEWKADLIIVNPLMAYVPGKQGEETEVFIREHLQPIATELNVGIIAIHHTPKIGRQNGVGTGANEYERQYNSAGKAEVVNAFRGIINIMPVKNGIFKFTADKRGRKIGWTWENKPTIERYFRHACDPDHPDLVWWRDATPEEASEAAAVELYQDILKALPEHHAEPVSRQRVHDAAKRTLNIGKHKADDWLKLAIEDGIAERVESKNEAGRNEALFRRAASVEEVWK